MNVKVVRRRNGGRMADGYAKPLPNIQGPLSIGHQEAGGGKKMACIRVYDIHGVENIELYQARVSGLKGNTIRLSGLECVERCWHLQEWEMTISTLDPVPAGPGGR